MIFYFSTKIIIIFLTFAPFYIYISIILPEYLRMSPTLNPDIKIMPIFEVPEGKKPFWITLLI